MAYGAYSVWLPGSDKLPLFWMTKRKNIALIKNIMAIVSMKKNSNVSMQFTW